MDFLVCPSCNNTLPTTMYHRNRSTRTGFARSCKACVNTYNRSYDAATPARKRERPNKKHTPKTPDADREAQMLRKYGLSNAAFEKLLLEQGGVCRICHGPEVARGKSGTLRRLCVDHDHACCPGKFTCGQCIRGLLCSRCNSALGNFRDDETILRSAIAYLSFPPT